MLEIKLNLFRLHRLGVDVRFCWAYAHVGVAGAVRGEQGKTPPGEFGPQEILRNRE